MNFKQWFENEIENNWLGPNPLPKKLKVYHGGSDFNDYSLDYLGNGEQRTTGMKSELGPGIYFSDCPYVARLYMKHSIGKSALHTAEIDTTNLLDRRYGTPHLNDVFKSIEQEIKDKYKGNRNIEEFLKTFGVERTLPQIMTPKEAAEKLAQHGIDGMFIRLPIGCLEIVVYNPKIITKVSKE